MDEFPNIEILTTKVNEGSHLIGLSLEQAKLRRKVGVTLLAIKRKDIIIEHPNKDVIFETKDLVYIMGNPEQLANAIEYISTNDIEK